MLLNDLAETEQAAIKPALYPDSSDYFMKDGEKIIARGISEVTLNYWQNLRL
ncbi:MAG TPA: hypothetical protein VKR53_00535 [Puia sp.]|nr:hypothetical protein [Puia sp.]